MSCCWLSLQGGSFGTGTDAGESSLAGWGDGRCFRSLLGPWRRDKGGSFCGRLSWLSQVCDKIQHRQKEEQHGLLSLGGIPGGHHTLQLCQHVIVVPCGVGTREGTCCILVALQGNLGRNAIT